jgi:drug/metabolite transporter (DMT)-like permease
MIYIFGLIVALQIVAGQALWKLAVAKYSFEPNMHYLASRQFIAFLFSPQVVLGVLIYAFATLSFMAMLSRYQYSSVQAITVTASLILTFLASVYIFREQHSLLNIAGVSLLILGVYLATKQS